MRNFETTLSGINISPLIQQIAQNPQWWNTNSARTSQQATVHYDVDDIILRYPGRGLANWNLEPFTVFTEAQSIVFALMARVHGELLGRVVISRLGAGKIIPIHVDHIGNLPMFYRRYQVPLASDEKTIFHCGEEQMALIPGNAYWFDNTLEHSVVNDSNDDRLSMIVDIRTFTPVVANGVHL